MKRNRRFCIEAERSYLIHDGNIELWNRLNPSLNDKDINRYTEVYRELISPIKRNF